MKWGKNLKKNVCICTTESLWYMPETNTTLQINYSPVQNEIFKKACMNMCIFLEEGTLAYLRETFHFGDIDYRVYNNSKFYDNCEDNTFIL